MGSVARHVCFFWKAKQRKGRKYMEHKQANEQKHENKGENRLIAPCYFAWIEVGW